jgi:hypothetical protein
MTKFNKIALIGALFASSSAFATPSGVELNGGASIIGGSISASSVNASVANGAGSSATSASTNTGSSANAGFSVSGHGGNNPSVSGSITGGTDNYSNGGISQVSTGHGTGSGTVFGATGSGAVAGYTGTASGNGASVSVGQLGGAISGSESTGTVGRNQNLYSVQNGQAVSGVSSEGDSGFTGTGSVAVTGHVNNSGHQAGTVTGSVVDTTYGDGVASSVNRFGQASSLGQAGVIGGYTGSVGHDINGNPHNVTPPGPLSPN